MPGANVRPAFTSRPKTKGSPGVPPSDSKMIACSNIPPAPCAFSTPLTKNLQLFPAIPRMSKATFWPFCAANFGSLVSIRV